MTTTSPEATVRPTQAAHTSRAPVYPGYINLRTEGRGYAITVRADPTMGLTPEVGELASIRLTADELRNWLRDATNLLMSGMRA